MKKKFFTIIKDCTIKKFIIHISITQVYTSLLLNKYVMYCILYHKILDVHTNISILQVSTFLLEEEISTRENQEGIGDG